MPHSPWPSLRSAIDEASGASGHIWAATASVRLSDLAGGTAFGGRLLELADKSVLLATSKQITAALALIELDGVARRIVICPPDLPTNSWPHLIDNAEVDAIVCDRDTPQATDFGVSVQ